VTPHGGKEKDDHHCQEMVPNREKEAGQRDVIQQELKLYP
jgi:hypothetical protein